MHYNAPIFIITIYSFILKTHLISILNKIYVRNINYKKSFINIYNCLYPQKLLLITKSYFLDKIIENTNQINLY